MMSAQALNVYWRFLSESSVLGVVSDAYLPLFQHLFPGWVFKKYSEAETLSATDKLSASTIIDFRSDESSATLLKKVAADQKFYFDFSGERKIVNLNAEGEVQYFETVKIKDHAHEIGTEISAWKMDAELITTYIGIVQNNREQELQKPAVSNIRNIPKDAKAGTRFANGHVLIFPCGTTDAKKWPVENWQALIDDLKKRGFGAKIFLGPSESSYQKLFDEKAEVYINQPWSSIIQSFDQNTLVICNDCGPMHVAGTMGCRLIALFGPTNEKVWFTYQGTGVALKKTENSWPSVDDVLSAITAFQNRKHEPSAANSAQGIARFTNS
jgi:ADP-heptose:LPS heptosyltransferase